MFFVWYQSPNALFNDALCPCSDLSCPDVQIKVNNVRIHSLQQFPHLRHTDKSDYGNVTFGLEAGILGMINPCIFVFPHFLFCTCYEVCRCFQYDLRSCAGRQLHRIELSDIDRVCGISKLDVHTPLWESPTLSIPSANALTQVIS